MVSSVTASKDRADLSFSVERNGPGSPAEKEISAVGFRTRIRSSRHYQRRVPRAPLPPGDYASVLSPGVKGELFVLMKLWSVPHTSVLMLESKS